MKKGKSLFYVTVFMMLLAGCQDYNSTPVPTETVAPTATSIPEPTPTPLPTASPTPTEIPHEHTWESKSTEATCTTNGSTWSECECGETKDTVEIFAIGHTTVTNTLREATEAEDGLWEEVCIVCEEVIDSGTIAYVHEHTWEEKSLAATCTEAGSTWFECVCGEQKDIVELPATDHIAYEKVITKEPTVDEEGTYEMRCTACEAVMETGTIEKLKPTPTPKPTSTQKPTATPKPTAIPRKDPMEEYTWWDVNHEMIRYTDESCTEVERIWYDLNLVMEYITLENFSDEVLGYFVDIPVYDYPSHDANIIATIENRYYDDGTVIRGQAKALKRCVETGWYYVEYAEGQAKGGRVYYGYVDDEYMRAGAKSGTTTNGLHCPMYEYSQPELYLGPNHELAKPSDLIISVGANKKISVSAKSINLYYMLYEPDLHMSSYEDGEIHHIGVFSVEDTSIAELSGLEYLFYNNKIGYFDTITNRSYSSYFTGKSVGTTTITLTEYEIYNYQYNDRNPTFDLGQKINEVSFDITVTE